MLGADPSVRMRSQRTRTPFLVSLDDFIHLFNWLKATALRFIDNLRITPFLRSKQQDIQHVGPKSQRLETRIRPETDWMMHTLSKVLLLALIGCLVILAINVTGMKG